MLWKQGMSSWVEAGTVRELFGGNDTYPSAPPVATASRPLHPIDVRPILERTTTNCISKVEEVRDRIHDYFVEACRREMAEALLVKSAPYVMPVGLRFECWAPHPTDPHLRDRSSVDVTIEPMDFHRFEYVVHLKMQDNYRPRNYRGVVEFGPQHAEAIVRHLLRRTGQRSPSFDFTYLRAYWFQLWRPCNPLVRLNRDWTKTFALVVLVVGILCFCIPVVGIVLGLFLLAGSIALLLWCRWRRSYTISPGKPFQEPRLLVRLDSWQALVPNLGKQVEAVQADLMQEFGNSSREGIQVQDEKRWQWGVDGIEERRQLVCRLRRGQAFIHVYRYGEDLFVGWDAHVNAGDWGEKELAVGTDPETGEYCRVNTIQAVWHTPGEYDLIDTICLAEWVHGAVTKVVKRITKQYNIDHEIDFKIIRGERQNIVGRQETPAESNSGLIGRVARTFRFKREG